MRFVDVIRCLGGLTFDYLRAVQRKFLFLIVSTLLMFSLCLKENRFYILLLLLRLVLCCVADLKSVPVHLPLCSLYFTIGPLQSAESRIQNSGNRDRKTYFEAYP